MSSVDELYDVGTFVQIMEVHDMKDKMRMIIQGHRRSGEIVPVFARKGDHSRVCLGYCTAFRGDCTCVCSAYFTGFRGVLMVI